MCRIGISAFSHKALGAFSFCYLKIMMIVMESAMHVSVEERVHV